MTREQQAAKAYAIIQARQKAGLRPIGNTELAQTIGYARQNPFIRLIPIMQRMADADGYYLARPHATNNYALTLLPKHEPELAMLSELARDRHRATRQRNNVIGGLAAALSQHSNPRIRQAAMDVSIRDNLARQADDAAQIARKNLERELRNSLGMLTVVGHSFLAVPVPPYPLS